MAKYVYVGAAGAPATGSGPKMQGAYRLDAATGKWEQMAGGLPANVEVRSITHPAGIAEHRLSRQPATASGAATTPVPRGGTCPCPARTRWSGRS